ncbi:MAG TPA: hypothetical protein VHM90_12470 [Phycisphaerae bacterium]|nr:hypothetical protein [Phycisphaerae bacterium]
MATLKARVDALEAELAELKCRWSTPTGGHDWVEKIGGKFRTAAERAAFDEAMRYGRKWRESHRPRGKKNRKTSS